MKISEREWKEWEALAREHRAAPTILAPVPPPPEPEGTRWHLVFVVLVIIFTIGALVYGVWESLKR